jgi:hypothetical protein
MPHGYFDFLDQRDRLGFEYRVSSTNAMNIHRQNALTMLATNHQAVSGLF